MDGPSKNKIKIDDINLLAHAIYQFFLVLRKLILLSARKYKIYDHGPLISDLFVHASNLNREKQVNLVINFIFLFEILGKNFEKNKTC